ncbi:MAG: MarR family winged helix-turn-helix transcriptional regulator [Eubacterium sp.]
MKNEICPCCKNHCDLENIQCRRGAEYAKSLGKSEGEHGIPHSDNSIASARYEEMDTDNKLIINLRDLGHTLRFLYEGKGSQKRILIILNETGSITQRELTQRLGVKPGSASEVIAKLEDSGLIKRTQSEEDRRTADIELTDAGKELAEKAADDRKNRHREMFSCLSQEEKNTLLSLLEKVNSDWNQRYNLADEHIHHGEHGHHKKHHKHHNRFFGKH